MLFFIEKGFEHFSFVTVSGISWLRWSVVDLTGRAHETYPRPVHVGVRRGKLAVGRIYPRVLVFASVSIIPPMLHVHSFYYHRCNITSAIGNSGVFSLLGCYAA
jgi:hypothetical protein